MDVFSIHRMKCLRQIPDNIKINCSVWTFLALLFCTVAQAQNLMVIDRPADYCATVSADTNQRMIELRSVIPHIRYDLRYATKKNFTRVQFYKNGKTTFLRLPVAFALKRVAVELAQSGYEMKIFDAYRPYAVTRKMWELVGDERYVANPANGSGHNRGLSVDLTLVNTRNGQDVDMGTGFDHFSDTAHHSFKDLPSQVLANRRFLREVMERHGFRALETEWWHYSWPNDRNYGVLDLSFRELKKRCQR